MFNGWLKKFIRSFNTVKHPFKSDYGIRLIGHYMSKKYIVDKDGLCESITFSRNLFKRIYRIEYVIPRSQSIEKRLFQKLRILKELCSLIHSAKKIGMKNMLESDKIEIKNVGLTVRAYNTDMTIIFLKSKILVTLENKSLIKNGIDYDSLKDLRRLRNESYRKEEISEINDNSKGDNNQNVIS